MSRRSSNLASAHPGRLQQTSTPLDFRRPDRIAKSQLRAIHQMHENFVRSLASGLSAYLRTNLTVNLVSVEQLSYVEFVECLPAPTCLASLSLTPFEGSAVMELNPSLVFPILELLLGGDGKLLFNASRETTDLEQILLEGLLKHIIRDLREAWKIVCPIEFGIQRMERIPQQLKVFSPTEAVVAIAIEIKLGDNTGMLNIAIPSINIKMMGQKLDGQWTSRRADVSEADQQRTLRLIHCARLTADARLKGKDVLLRDLANMEPGDVINLRVSAGTPLDLVLNGQSKYTGQVIAAGRRAGFRVLAPITDPAHSLRRAW